MTTPAPASPQSCPVATRTQYRVGHGGFHTTIVEGAEVSFTYVYDVGASPRKSLVLNAIDDFISEMNRKCIENVDFVILSHIDEDHVNSFRELVNALDQAGIDHPTVMLPWLEPVEKLFALAHANGRQNDAVAVTLAGDDSDVISFFEDLNFTDVAYLLPADDQAILDPPAGSRFVRSGTDIALGQTVPWTLVATRIEPNQSILTDFRNQIVNRTGLDPKNSADRRTLVKYHRSIIRQEMCAASKRASLSGYGSSLTNWSSISIFGSSPSPTHAKCNMSVSNNSDLTVDCDHAWLHTGDLPLDIPAVWNTFDYSWSQNLPSNFGSIVCALAAPHHGSPHGHNPKLFAKFSPNYVLYMTGWTAGSAKSASPIYAKRINPSISKHDALAAKATTIELNNP